MVIRGVNRGSGIILLKEWEIVCLWRKEGENKVRNKGRKE